MNSDLVDHMIDFLRREKPTLRELSIPAYTRRFLEEIESAGFSIRKKSEKFTPSADKKAAYFAKVDNWQKNFDLPAFRAAFPHHDIEAELAKAHLWLKKMGETGDYRKRLDQFFHNWLSKAKPTNLSQGNHQTQTSPATLGDARDAAIAQGIRDLAASRSEKLYPTEFDFRFSVAKRDLSEIPTDHLPEVFRRARFAEIRGTPGVYHVLEAWKKLKSDLRDAKARLEKEIRDKQERDEEALRAQLTPEERAAEASRTLQRLTQSRV